MLDVLFWRLRAWTYVNCNLWSKKPKKISTLFFFFSFWSSKPCIRIHLKCWIRIRIQWIQIHSSAFILQETPQALPACKAWWCFQFPIFRGLLVLPVSNSGSGFLISDYLIHWSNWIQICIRNTTALLWAKSNSFFNNTVGGASADGTNTTTKTVYRYYEAKKTFL